VNFLNLIPEYITSKIDIIARQDVTYGSFVGGFIENEGIFSKNFKCVSLYISSEVGIILNMDTIFDSTRNNRTVPK
jgi:hypothetical protein